VSATVGFQARRAHQFRCFVCQEYFHRVICHARSLPSMRPSYTCTCMACPSFRPAQDRSLSERLIVQIEEKRDRIDVTIQAPRSDSVLFSVISVTPTRRSTNTPLAQCSVTTNSVPPAKVAKHVHRPRSSDPTSQKSKCNRIEYLWVTIYTGTRWVWGPCANPQNFDNVMLTANHICCVVRL